MPPSKTKGKSPTFRWREDRNKWEVRFSHGGKRWAQLLDADKAQSERRGWTFFNEVLAGRVVATTANNSTPTSQLLALFLAAISSEVTDGTLKIYTGYCARFAEAMPTLGDVTSASIGNYQRDRLAAVKRKTLTKERSVLSRFVDWLVEQAHIESAPKFPKVNKKALGTPYAVRRRGAATPVTAEQVAQILALLPEHGRGGPCRSKYVFLFETGLRPTTVAQISVPEHWRPGATELRITAEMDKSRWARTLLLSALAIEALERASAGKRGLAFGATSFRTTLKAAAAQVLPADLAERFTAYDLRHALATELGQLPGASLAGLAYLFGWRQVTTGNRYIGTQKSAADSIIEQRSGSRTGSSVSAPSELQTLNPGDLAGAKKRTRTSTSSRTLEPEGSANSETRALSVDSSANESQEKPTLGVALGPGPNSADAAWGEQVVGYSERNSDTFGPWDLSAIRRAA